MAQRSGLGKGLGALIPKTESPQNQPTGDLILKIPVGNIKPNPQQPRKQFDNDQLRELADSIREHGILQPLVVIESDKPGLYTLIAGERRLRASKLAGLKDVPAILRTASYQEQLEFALIENVQREDLNPIERALAFQNLLEEFSLTHEEIARRVGKSRVAITNSLRLLNLPQPIQDLILKGVISEGHGRALLSLPTPAAIQSAIDTIVRQNLNVRQTEALVSKFNQPKSKPQAPSPESLAFADLEARLRRHLQTRVSLQKGPKGGTITISFYSDEELNELLEKLGLND